MKKLSSRSYLSYPDRSRKRKAEFTVLEEPREGRQRWTGGVYVASLYFLA